jgi:protein-disulfide isomerase-like protein with CxxC motif
MISCILETKTFNHSSVEGMIDEDGNFYVAVCQLRKQLGLSTNAQRLFKKLMKDTGLKLVKVKCNTINNKPVNAMSLAYFKRLLYRLHVHGYPTYALYKDLYHADRASDAAKR